MTIFFTFLIEDLSVNLRIFVVNCLKECTGHDVSSHAHWDD